MLEAVAVAMVSVQLPMYVVEVEGKRLSDRR
jgi:hypothetical protein